MSDEVAASCHELAVEQCATWVACIPGASSSHWVDLDGCVSQQDAICRRTTSLSGVVRWPETVACMVARDRGAPDCPRFQETELLPGSCGSPGTFAAGAHCADSAQCASGVCAYPDHTCQVCFERVATGEECGGTRLCERGDFCDRTGARPVCKPITPGSCDVCYGRCVGGRCEPALAFGEKCSSSADCTQEGTCDSSTHVCTLIPLSDVDGPCSDAPELGKSKYRVCRAGLFCAAGGLCRPGGGLGETCFGHPCQAVLQCNLATFICEERNWPGCR